MTRPPRRRFVPLAGAVLALGLLVACGDDGDGTDDPTDATSTTPSATGSDASGSATDPATTDATTGTPAPAAIPVYYVGDTPQGERLYREFVQTSGVDPLVAAAAALTQGDPVDPDYRTLWPKGRFASVERADGAIVVGLADGAWLGRGGLDPASARLAVQQLVLTLQGVLGERLPVTVERDGRPAATLLGVKVGGGLTARPQLDVLALVNVTEPAEGSVVSGTFAATGRASSFEATVPWTVEDQSGKVVLDGFATAEGWIDKLYPWETQVDVSGLDPGRYTFVARTDDPSGGEGGGPHVDTKRITVE